MRPKWSGINQTAFNPIVAGHKFCGRCGRWRQINDFGPNNLGQPRSYCQTCQRLASRRFYKQRGEKALERDRESSRMYREAKRRERGTPVRNFSNRRTVIDRPERVLLPREPLVREMRAFLKITGMGWESLARRAGVDSRSLHRIEHGESKRVRIDLADKIAVAMDIPLSLIYPHD